MLDKDFSSEGRFFPAMPRPGRSRTIYPVFLPFSGCPQRCIFCAQDVQSGRSPDAVPHILRSVDKDLRAMSHKGRAGLELAFFGGTFTALADEDLAACLDFARSWIQRGTVRSFRCSTRPDALSGARLDALRRSGCATVELGVQSFSDSALKVCRRGYDGQRARDGCARVREAGLSLGIQLMPGLPGQSREEARQDVLECLALRPLCARLYPCLVIGGTALAGAWQEGRYQPWGLDETVAFLAWACRILEEAGIAVIRMGLAEEPGLAARVLAGPRHPALGGLVRSLALYHYIEERLNAWRPTSDPGSREGESRPQTSGPDDLKIGLQASGPDELKIGLRTSGPDDLKIGLRVPRRLQGLFWGHGGELAASYAALGLERERVFFEDREDFMLFTTRN